MIQTVSHNQVVIGAYLLSVPNLFRRQRELILLVFATALL